MKKLLTLLIAVSIVTILFAQNQGNQFGNSGNVGIGTNNPNYPLEVYGQSKFHGKFGVDSVAVFSDTLIMMEVARAEDDLIVVGDLIMEKYKSSTLQAPRIAYLGIDGEFIPSENVACITGKDNNYYPIWESGIEKITTYCQGESFKIGVNTNNPLQELDIRGNGYFSEKVGIGTSTPELNLDVIGDQYISGFLGIGISDPFCRLDIETDPGSLNLLAARYVSSSGGATPTDNELFFVPRLSNAATYNTMSSENDFGIFWSDNSHSGGILNENSGLVIGPHNWTLTSPGIKIGANGFIGIGNKAPSKRVEISNGCLLISGNNGTDGNARFVIEDDGTTADFMQFTKGSQNILRLTNNGTLFIRGIEVKSTILFPDYVFDENYDLIDLNELKLFVDEEKHLPGVPTAEEVLKNGINLEKMNVVLLEKVEELTLYIIKMNEMIENQQVEIEKLKQK